MRSILTLLFLVGCHASQPTPPASEGVALAIVYSGQGYWIGNDDYVTDLPDRMAGAHAALRAAIDQAFAALPRGSQVAIVSYAYEPKLRLPLVPVPPQASRVVGSQREYADNISNELVPGITLGLEELARSELRRKAIVVIGDGFAVEHAVAVRELPKLRALAQERGVVTHAVVVPSEADADFLAMGMRRATEHWTANVVALEGRAELPAALTEIVRGLSR